jgi:aerobic-type carbon monoxide dehydrogenase small subunit (CoxS/CutS family)/CO/xanthine dehydrogenase FAD-binding subunit
VLARGIERYHRPDRIEEALERASAGAVPLAGGTRLLAENAERPALVDLEALGLAGIERPDGDLVLGAMVTLQDVIDAPQAYPSTAGLLPAACRAHSASRLLRSMATLGGEAVHASPDSEVVAALLALNAIFVVRRADATAEIPALRFLRNPSADLAGGGLVTSILIPGTPDGAALERVAVLPSAPPLLAVAASISMAGDACTRARLAYTGLTSAPARILEAESRLERGNAGGDVMAQYVDEVRSRAPFRDDAHASASYRREIAGPLIVRALSKAIGRAQSGKSIGVPRLRPPRLQRELVAVPELTSGEIEVEVNGKSVRAGAEAGSTLLDWLREQGFWGVKHGCETGECGACAVLLDGLPVSSCLTLAARAHGRSVTTVEGLGDPDQLDPIQAAFVDTGAIQCGFCTPGMELSAKALLDAVPDPTEAEVREALAGCLCRCTGYVKPVEAVMRAAKTRANGRKADRDG